MNPDRVRVDELKAKIRESGITQIHIANNLRIGLSALQNKINGRSEFKVTEMFKLSRMLGLTYDEMVYIFDSDLVNSGKNGSKK